MPLEPEALYRQLGQIVAEIPGDLYGPAPISADTHCWLGRAALLVEECLGEFDADTIQFKVAADGLQGVLQHDNAHRLISVLYRALARAEQNAPASAQGAFIPAGGQFSSFQAIGNVLSEARTGALIIDAYMGAKALTDFAPLAPERTTVRLLGDSNSSRREVLRAAAGRWTSQYGAARPLEIRLTAPRLLHDRLIIVDGQRVWSLTQSLEHFADRAPASVLRVEGDIAAQKIAAYEQMWGDAQRLET